MAGIIKAGKLCSSTARGTSEAYQFDDMGDDYLVRVRGEANRMIAEARNEAAQLKAQAAEEGRQAALAAVEASLRKQIDEQSQSAIKAVGRAISAIDQSRQAWQRHWEQHAIAVAIAIAGRIVRREIAQAPQITIDVVREALELASGHQPIVLRLNPGDLRALGPQVDQVIAQLRLIGQAQVVADPSIASGGCKLETEYGAIDGQIATQLARIAEELT
jgi:flagellar assembly protein FliH